MAAGEHTLPDLPYSYDALEPYIDEQTMRLHHSKHHQGYVDGLNAAERSLAKARKEGDFSDMRQIQRSLAFNGSGHFNHTLFWNNMTPAEDSGEPEGELLKHLDKDFGGFESFKEQFSAAAGSVEGSGWGFLVWVPEGQYLTTVAAENHQKQFINSAIPLLAIDVWEHAYYLKYQNKRGEYIDNWFNIVDWENVAHNLDRAKDYEFPVQI